MVSPNAEASLPAVKLQPSQDKATALIVDGYRRVIEQKTGISLN